MTNRIYFKKFLSEDDFQYFLNFVSNERIMIMNYGRVFSLEEAKKFYSRLLENNNKNENFGSFKVFEMNTNIFIGSGALVISDDFTEAEIEYMLFPEYWGKGYGSEIVTELLKKAAETTSIQQVTGIIDPNNIASKKILLNNSFVSYKIYEIDDGTTAEMLSKKIIHPIL